MAQFGIYTNPVTRARRLFPYVVVLQSEVADTGDERIIAPLVARSRVPGTTGKLMPHVTIEDSEYIVLVPRLGAVRVADLRDPHGSLGAFRDVIVAALDHLFLGV